LKSLPDIHSSVIDLLATSAKRFMVYSRGQEASVVQAGLQVPTHGSFLKAEEAIVKLVVFSDLDATLLDRETYSWKPAERAIDALKKRDAALVMVTSKTLSETVVFHIELGFDDPIVFENGGGIGLSKHSVLKDELLLRKPKMEEFEEEGFAVFALGARYEFLVRSLAEISTEVGSPLRGFSGMSGEEVARATGLPADQTTKARMRLFDEPFTFPEDSRSLEARVRHAASRRGLDTVKGGRFWHLIGHAGKGKAVSILLECFQRRYGELVSIGLGDSPNDFPFLQLVDIPIGLGTEFAMEFALPLPERTRRYDVPGPKGWNQAVLDVLATL
jgi:mannosyl-3-phosphoglycerate phosphatase